MSSNPSSFPTRRSSDLNTRVSDPLCLLAVRPTWEGAAEVPPTGAGWFTARSSAVGNDGAGRGPRAHEIRQIRAIASGEAAVGGRRGSPCGPVALADHAARGGVIEISSYRPYVK